MSCNGSEQLSAGDFQSFSALLQSSLFILTVNRQLMNFNTVYQLVEISMYPSPPHLRLAFTLIVIV